LEGNHFAAIFYTNKKTTITGKLVLAILPGMARCTFVHNMDKL
jgi:hypothetical protein